ncbi:MAG: STAS domain-containing protein [Planctomycetes bacterium]|nr:STAS domain-containing protein [Planctomycetota bacterium]
MSSTVNRPGLQIDAAAHEVSVVRITVPTAPAGDTVFSIFQDVYHLVDQEKRRKLVLDFSKVRVLNSAMLAFLLGLNQKITLAGGRLAVCHLSPEARNFFASFPRPLIHIYEDEPQALASFPS